MTEAEFFEMLESMSEEELKKRFRELAKQLALIREQSERND